ncbi:helix-turn-helix transcriptional regulator [Bifidobacterium sp. UTBIF-68]|uniref:helix-turn-helix domain-containing protein n=1 Tax=Bifidobacterium sp. UTBIF-68 TaxID=1465262 RepID=UPI00112610E2
MRVSNMIDSQASQDLQDIVTKNIRILMAAYGTKQDEFAAALGIAQSGLSRKTNRRTDWTMPDLANAARFFNISVADLVLPITFSTGTRPDYQLRHNAAVDNPEYREVAQTLGPRYLVRPDDEADAMKKRGGNPAPRAIVRPDDPDFWVPSVGLEPTLRRF